MTDADVVTLNVGGVYFATRRSTLAASASFFAGLVDCSHASTTEFFVDRDPMYFRYVLNWMRGARALPDDEASLDELLLEADFYAMPGMCEAIRRAKRDAVPSLTRSLASIFREVRRQ